MTHRRDDGHGQVAGLDADTFNAQRGHAQRATNFAILCK
jgi:hypothetical protein